MSERRVRALIVAGFLCIVSLAAGLTVPSRGQDILSLTPARAFELVKEPHTYLVDVRSVAEYVLVGHPEMAYSVPTEFWSEEEAKFVENPSFLDDLAARFKKEDALIFICRSGGRSLRAAQEAAKAGFAKVSHVSEGFEGGLDEKGHRTVGGWKNSLPYTYKVDPNLAYTKAKGEPGRSQGHFRLAVFPL